MNLLLLEGIIYICWIITRKRRLHKQPSRYGEKPIRDSYVEDSEGGNNSDYSVINDPKTNRSVILEERDNEKYSDAISRMNAFFSDMESNKDDGMISIYSHQMKAFGKIYKGKEENPVMSCIIILVVDHSFLFYSYCSINCIHF